jgi:hypothetical protein
VCVCVCVCGVCQQAEGITKDSGPGGNIFFNELMHTRDRAIGAATARQESERKSEKETSPSATQLLARSERRDKRKGVNRLQHGTAVVRVVPASSHHSPGTSKQLNAQIRHELAGLYSRSFFLLQ